MFPKLVNLSMPFMKAKHSSRFMSVIVGAMQVEWHEVKKYQEDPSLPELLKLHEDFLKVNGVKLADIYHIEEFVQVLATLRRFKDDEREKIKADGLHLTCEYLMRFDYQVLKNLLDDESKFKALQKTTFLAEYVSDDI